MGKGSARASVMRRTGGRCHYCGDVANTVDHIVPRSLGGPSAQWNLTPACKDCNGLKASLLGVCPCFDCIAALRRFEGMPTIRRVKVARPQPPAARPKKRKVVLVVSPIGVCPVTLSGEHVIAQGDVTPYCVRCYEVVAA